MNRDDTHITGDRPEPGPDVAIDEPEAKAEFDKLARAFRRGADEAKRGAKEVIPSLRKALANLGYGVAFGTSYGVTFGATVAKELVPDVMREGATKGAEAGGQAARELMSPEGRREPDSDEDGGDYSVT